jgi:hypothetical protein
VYNPSFKDNTDLAPLLQRQYGSISKDV